MQNQETVRAAKAEMGEVYHPYNTKTGAKQDSEKVSELLGSCFERIQGATKDLSDRCRKRVEKAHRVVKNMVATIAFFFNMIEVYMDNMQLSDHEKKLMHVYLIIQRMISNELKKRQKDYSQQNIMIYLNGYWKKWITLFDLGNI